MEAVGDSILLGNFVIQWHHQTASCRMSEWQTVRVLVLVLRELCGRCGEAKARMRAQRCRSIEHC
jgi:hypothetical protein